MARAVGTRGRFFVAYLVLGAVVGTGIGLFIVLLERPGPPPPPPWSAWRPASSSPATRIQEIASHVGRAYRLPNGGQLARVAIGALNQSRQTLLTIGIQTKVRPKTIRDFRFFARNKSIVYTLCGDGPHCTLDAAAATTEPGVLLSREGLELALYTLKYARPIDNVAILAPPAPKRATPTAALFFRRDDLASQLSRPLRRTLPDSTAALSGRVDPAEKRTVLELTGGRVYRYGGISRAPARGQWLTLVPPS